jgi:phosphoesterase RecJ-like protein
LGVAYTVINHNNQDHDLTPVDVSDGVANFLNNISGVKAALILQQLDDATVKGSFRTNQDLIDVSKLAKILGGGGHRKAAGFKIKGQLFRAENGQWQIV